MQNNTINDNANIGYALKVLRARAKPKPSGECAKFVRIALEAGGFNIARPRCGYAKGYGDSLIAAGFNAQPLCRLDDYEAAIGDIAIIQPYCGGHPAGHMQMYDGLNWISDWVQRQPFWPGIGYAHYKPPFRVYRPSSKTRVHF